MRGAIKRPLTHGDKLNSIYWPNDAEKWNYHDEPTS